MSSYERERYVEVNKVCSDYAMKLGALHSEIKRVLREQDKRIAGDTGEHVSWAIEQLRVEYERQAAELDEAVAEGQANG